jgi:nucleotide-binding universal stress UspA family protein
MRCLFWAECRWSTVSSGKCGNGSSDPICWRRSRSFRATRRSPRSCASPPKHGRGLCQIDFSPNSRTALQYAATLARRCDSDLLVLYVEDPLLAIATATRSDARSLICEGERELLRFTTSVVRPEAPGMAVTLVTSAGKPATEIVKAAERHRCDLIVMGYRGVGGASKFFFGSTTEGVVRMTSIPVLAIPPARRQSGRAGRAQRSGLKRAS